MMIVKAAKSCMKNWWRFPYSQPFERHRGQRRLGRTGALVDDDRRVGEDPDQQTAAQTGHPMGVEHPHGVVDLLHEPHLRK